MAAIINDKNYVNKFAVLLYYFKCYTELQKQYIVEDFSHFTSTNTIFASKIKEILKIGSSKKNKPSLPALSC